MWWGSHGLFLITHKLINMFSRTQLSNRIKTYQQWHPTILLRLLAFKIVEKFNCQCPKHKPQLFPEICVPFIIFFQKYVLSKIGHSKSSAFVADLYGTNNIVEGHTFSVALIILYTSSKYDYIPLLYIPVKYIYFPQQKYNININISIIWIL